MPQFQDREEEIKFVCGERDPTSLLNVYGVGGVGKTRLLAAAASQLRQRGGLVFYVDLGGTARQPHERPDQVLNALVAASEERLTGTWLDADQVAGQIVGQLIGFGQPVCLMFDSTEAVQDDMEFWSWLESNLVGPLVLDGRVRQVFAGRVPVPWRRVEVRRQVRLLALKPLPLDEDPSRAYARRLVQEVLLEHNPDLRGNPQMAEAIGRVLYFSLGHPQLAQAVAAYVAQQDLAQPRAVLYRQAGEAVVQPFIESSLFAGISPGWQRILRWASVLAWFDATTLQRYLNIVEPGLVGKDWDAYFIQGIARLRIYYTAVAWETAGYRLYGIIRDIVKNCFQIVDPPAYLQAVRAAATMLHELAGEFEPDDEDARRYEQEAKDYTRVAEEMMA